MLFRSEEPGLIEFREFPFRHGHAGKQQRHAPVSYTHLAQVRSLLPEQGFVLDLKQAHQVGCDPFAMIDAMGPRLRHLHMLDWTASRELVLPGEGIMDFSRLFRRLAQMGYTGAAILEPYAIQGRDPQRLRRSLDYLRRQMEEAQA